MDLNGFSFQVWDQNNPGMADYVNIPVGNAIIPSHRRVTLGDIVCFSSPVITAAGKINISNRGFLSLCNVRNGQQSVP